MEKRDYYQVLGVERGADPGTIKSAYRRCAMEFHPDRNPGDKQAEERFKEAAEAYEVLSNPQKRAHYDQFGHAGPNGGGVEFSGMEDILSHFADIFGMGFGGRPRSRRGADLQVAVKLTFQEAMKGCHREIPVEKQVACTTCGGSGCKPGTNPDVCGTCRGRGQVMQSMGFVRIASPCPSCRGQGRVIKDKCGSCGGSGAQRETEKIAIDIPAGVDDGTTLEVSHRGMASHAGGPPGHLYVNFSVEPDPRFERHGDDLLTEVALSFPQAALGAKVAVPTIDGEELIELPPGTQSGTVKTLRGKGAPHCQRRGAGDLHVRFHVVVPTKLDGEQRKVVEQLAQALDGHPVEVPEERESSGGLGALFGRRKKRK